VLSKARFGQAYSERPTARAGFAPSAQPQRLKPRAKVVLLEARPFTAATAAGMKPATRLR